MNLVLLRAFGVVTVQGAETVGRRRFGVPPGGAFDRGAWRIANALVGLPEETSVLELGLANAQFRAPADGMVAVVGAPVAVTVDGHGAAAQAAFPVHGGAEIHVGPPESGARAYVAYRPGERGRIRRLVRHGEALGLADRPLRVVAGPQGEHFDLRDLTGAQLRVGMASDRVGIRLDGVFAPHRIDLPSEPACVGAIQVTGDGQLVILGPDGPTIGGYPKVAVVIDADRDRLAQLRPGSAVGFEVVSSDDARELRAERRERLRRVIASLRAGDVRAPLFADPS